MKMKLVAPPLYVLTTNVRAHHRPVACTSFISHRHHVDVPVLLLLLLRSRAQLTASLKQLPPCNMRRRQVYRPGNVSWVADAGEAEGHRGAEGGVRGVRGGHQREEGAHDRQGRGARGALPILAQYHFETIGSGWPCLPQPSSGVPPLERASSAAFCSWL